MIDLVKFGYDSKSIDLILEKCFFRSRENVSAINPIFKQARIWDSLAIDEILRSSFVCEIEYQNAISIVNEIGADKVALVDLLPPKTPVNIPSSIKLVAFPGLAANEKVFSAIDFGNLSIVSVDYSDIDFSKNIDAVVDEIIAKYSITNEQILLGTSFGGLLANRISAVLKNKHVLMFGALVNASELGYLRRLVIRSRVPNLFPLNRIPKYVVRYFFGIKTHDCENAFYGMLNKFSARKVSEMLNFICRCEDVNCNATMRIHGDNDLLIPQPENVDEYFAAGHIITMIENNSKSISIANYYEN